MSALDSSSTEDTETVVTKPGSFAIFSGAYSIQQVLEYLNDDPNTVYALTFNADLKAWRVVQLERVRRDVNDYAASLYKIVPGGTNHNALAHALRDAIILRQAQQAK